MPSLVTVAVFREGVFPARNQKGENLLLFLGIIDILQNYRLLKKLEHTWKSVLHDGVRCLSSSFEIALLQLNYS